jgi:O-acetylhomoserine/O-acetylserine sulfhydrylase-like pyridoxal-dependent enzyme
MTEVSLDTLAIHAGEKPNAVTGALTPAIEMSAAFQLPGFGPSLFDALMMESERPPFAYARWGNPTAQVLEDKMAALEGGEAALALASGMAAISAVIFGLLTSEDHLVASEVCYAGAVELFGLHLPRQGIQVSLVDTNHVDEVRAALRPNTRMVYVETPAQPYPTDLGYRQPGTGGTQRRSRPGCGLDLGKSLPAKATPARR